MYSALQSGGELGIRTPDTFRYASFQDWCNRPLYQLSMVDILCKCLYFSLTNVCDVFAIVFFVDKLRAMFL